MSVYQIATSPSTEITASRRKTRNILRLLGCSRQEVASRRAKAAVSSGVSRRAYHRVHDSRRGAGDDTTGRSWTGLMARPITELQSAG